MELQLIEKFQAQFGYGASHAFRCPGRVNLIGEHIDYSGYAVLPMAIEQNIQAVAARRTDGKINLVNYDPKYKSYSSDASVMDIDRSGTPKWHHYFLCGYKGIMEYLKETSFLLDASFGMDVLIYGSVPPSAGLSSSSALVCCAALITLKLATNEDFDRLSRERFAELCAGCERYIGTEGGGMDQAICFLAKSGKAKLIEFNPLRTLDLQVPPGAKFVICNCCVQMNKAASSHFNQRVVECRIAAKMLVSKKGKDWTSIKRLSDAQEMLGLQLETMPQLVEEELHAEPYSAEEICDVLGGITIDEFKDLCLTANTKHLTSFDCYKRAKHCFSEAYRVYQYATVCKTFANGKIDQSKALESLGSLMNASHDSCRDLYECSCPELDKLVSLSRSFGALGSRLTGAGWGGCAVSLVPDDVIESFLSQLDREYYGKLPDELIGLATESAVFITSPGDGARVQTV